MVPQVPPAPQSLFCAHPHSSPTQAVSLPHEFEHDPHSVGILVTMVSQPSSASGCLQLSQPSAQYGVHAPLVQSRESTLAVLHTRMQLPQCSGSSATLTSQPSAFSRLQSARPGLQTKLHPPWLHTGTALGAAGQATPHPPQCCGLVWVFTHCPEQFTCGWVHTAVHCPDWHTLPEPQATPQPPQWELSERVLTQALPHLV